MDKKWMKFLHDENFRAAEELPELKQSTIPLPSPSFNWAVGNGGIVEGKWVLLFGPESGGKSLIAQVLMAAIQKKHPDGICIVFDTEFSLSKEWFTKLGGDPSRLFLKQTNNPVEIFDWTEQKLKPQIDEGFPLKAFCIDSLRAIRYPKDEKSTIDSIMGGTGAGYLPRAFKTIIPTLRPNNVTTIIVQQVSENLDMYTNKRNRWVIPDGKALKHYSDYMLQIERLETKDSMIESSSGIVTGHRVRVVAKKNKVSAPYRKIEFTLDYDKGIASTENEIFELGKQLGIISHPINLESGKVNIQSWVIIDKPDETYRGEENIKKLVVSNPEVQQRIINLLDTVTVTASDNGDERELVDE